MICQDGLSEYYITKARPGAACYDAGSAEVEVVIESWAASPSGEVGRESCWAGDFDDHDVATLDMDDVTERDTGGLEIGADALHHWVTGLNDDGAGLVVEMLGRENDLDVPNHRDQWVFDGVGLLDMDSALSIGFGDHFDFGGDVALFEDLEPFISNHDIGDLKFSEALFGSEFHDAAGDVHIIRWVVVVLDLHVDGEAVSSTKSDLLSVREDRRAEYWKHGFHLRRAGYDSENARKAPCENWVWTTSETAGHIDPGS